MRPLSSLRLAFATPTGEPGKDTLVTHVRVFTACIGTATTFGSALARRHGSDLLTLRLHFVHKPAVIFGIAGLLEGSRVLPDPLTSRCEHSFCHAFWALLQTPIGAARTSRSVLVHSSNRYPLGNCDSPRPETGLEYLTRLEMVSIHFLPPGSYSLAGKCANITGGTGESCLPHLALAGPARRG